MLVDKPSKIAADEDDVNEAQDTAVDGLLQLMSQAKADLLIVSPYFVPGDLMMSQFADLRRRGVRVRLLLDEGQSVGPLARRVQAALAFASGSNGGGRSDPIFDDWLQRLLQIAGPDETDDSSVESGSAPAGGELSAAGAALPALAEPLTRKEIRVLQLLAEGYSNGAMAEKLFVSDSTVRTHLRNINMKLNARSRTQAVAIARRLGVMS